MSGFRGHGDVGLPPNVKEGGKRVDFKSLNSRNDTDFDFLIETKCPRFAWSRGGLCPCLGLNPQAPDRPDPKCPTCNGQGRFFFTPKSYVVDESRVGTLDETQARMVAEAGAVVVKALVVNATSQPDIYNVLGRFSLGSATCTIRQGNRLGYYDRLISLDDEMIYCEVRELRDDSPVSLRYPIVAVNDVRSSSKVFGEEDLCLEEGRIRWRTGKAPAPNTRVSFHYVCRPVWTVLEHTKLNRTTLIKQKKANPTTPQGDVVLLPPQYLIRLEHLPMGVGD